MDKKLKVFCFSDTHTYHAQLNVPADADMVICAGDVTNPRAPVVNAIEMNNFLYWFNLLPNKHKVLVGGNHDTSLWQNHAHYVDWKDYPGVTYLEHERIVLDGVKLFGSPWTPTFGVGWAWNKDRSKLAAYWDSVPKDTDILITHGPPYGILDLSFSPEEELQFCGDKALLNRIREVEPKYHIFGHIHDMKGVLNAGTRTIDALSTVFINASSVTDGRFDLGLTSFGHEFSI